MSDQADLLLLRALDDPNSKERPPGFDWRIADAQFRALALDIARVLGVPDLELEGVESIQDASFHGQAVLPNSVLLTDQYGPAIVCASNFGRLAAVRPEEAVDPIVLASIKTVLTANGYVIVANELQDAHYD